MLKFVIGELKVPAVNSIQFVHYDEQHPKAGRNQMYRLTLLDSISRQVIADELFDSKDADTIEDFLRRNLDTHKPIFIVTDLYRGYNNILYVFSFPRIDCLMLVLVAEFTPTNNLRKVEKQQPPPQSLEINSPELAT